MWGLSDYQFALVIAIMIVGSVVLISGLGLFIMWIKYSWIERNNSQNYTGADMANIVLEKQGVQANVVPSWWMVKYFNYKKRTGKLKLRPWTYNRRSIWTMMEAAQQTFVASLRAQGRRAYSSLFRVPIYLQIGSSIFGVIALICAFKLDSLVDFKWYIVSIAFGVIAVLSSIAEVMKVGILKKHVVPVMIDSGLDALELEKIQRIYKWRFVYAVAQALLELLKLMLRASEKSNN